MTGAARVVIAVAALSLVAPAGVSAAGSTGLTGTTWSLATLGQKPPVRGTTVTIVFAKGRASGSAGCNQYGAAYASGRRSLQIKGPIASTQRACSAAVDAQEQAFFALLPQVEHYAIRGSTLTLRGSLGKELATFEAISQDLAGTSWTALAYNNGRGAVQSVLAGTTVTATFAAGGRLSGSAGCNGYGATFKAGPPSLTIGPVAATQKACASPDGVMEQEAAFLAALATAAAYSTDGARLELRTKSGATAVELTKR